MKKLFGNNVPSILWFSILLFVIAAASVLAYRLRPQRTEGTAALQKAANPIRATPVQSAGKIIFSDERVSGIALDTEYVYWIEPGKIVRQRLSSSEKNQPEVVATTGYRSGRFGLLNTIRNGDWLFFVDCDSPGIPANWTLSALNVKTHEQRIIAHNLNLGDQIFAYAVDGDRVAISFLEHTGSKNCPDDSVLKIVSISTLRQQELDRTCFSAGYNWSGVALSSERLIASRFYENSRKYQAVEYDLKSGTMKVLNQSLAMPPSFVDGGGVAASSAWLGWSSSENSAFLYNPLTSQAHQITAPSGVEILKFPQISGRWLYWRVNNQAVVYDTEQNVFRLLAKPAENQRVEEMTMYDNLVAWVVYPQADQASGGSVIEWSSLPPE